MEQLLDIYKPALWIRCHEILNTRGLANYAWSSNTSFKELGSSIPVLSLGNIP